MPQPRLEVTREQIVAFRRTATGLDERLPMRPDSLRRAAWAGLTDSMPRAAVLQIHARVEGTQPMTWADPALVQLWGPRFSVYVVAKEDLAVFSLGRHTESGSSRRRAEDLAVRLHAETKGEKVLHDDAGSLVGVHPNALRYAAPTGTVLIRWAGARQATVWTVPRPSMDVREARLELARRFLHVFGPTTASSFAEWAGIGVPDASAAFDGLARELAPVRTPIGDAWVLADDETTLRSPAAPGTGVRLLPSGDAFYLLWGADRELLVPDAARRAALWTSRVWPGAVLLDGEVVGVWRRAGPSFTIETWRRLTGADRDLVAAEAASLPLPGVEGRVRVTWGG